MAPKARNLLLTQSQAACLIALRHGKESQPKIAVEGSGHLQRLRVRYVLWPRSDLPDRTNLGGGMPQYAERYAASRPFRIDRAGILGYPAPPGGVYSNSWIDRCGGARSSKN